jgi:cytochrome c biogenesis protein ResB
VLYSLRVTLVYRFLKSVRLAVVLILVITALALLATFLPQNRPADWYRAHYGAPVAAVVLALRLDRFFSRSPVFLVPVLLFALNLGTCAVDRVVTRQRHRAPRRYGPDLIHVGLLVLIGAGLVTAGGRAEENWRLAAGEEAAISPAYTVHLLSLDFQKYDNGMPKEWTSTVRVSRAGVVVNPSFAIEVNHPLRLKGLSVYQSDWGEVIDLTDERGRPVTASSGQGFQDGDSFWYFADTTERGDGLAAVFQQYKGHALVSSRTLGPGEQIGPFTVKAVFQVSGLKVVHDPGLAPFFAAAGLVLLGLALTFIQRRGGAAQ